MHDLNFPKCKQPGEYFGYPYRVKMTHMRFLMSLVAFLALTQMQLLAQEQSAFELRAADGGVKVYVRSEANNEMSVRVTTTARSTVSAAMAVIDDAPNYPKWVHRKHGGYHLPAAIAHGPLHRS